MIVDSDKLASIHSKIRAIHQRFEATGVQSSEKYSKCGEDCVDVESGGGDHIPANKKIDPSSTSSSCIRVKCCGWGKALLEVGRRKCVGIRGVIQRQSFYAHCFKLLALFIVALVHLVYMHPFLEMFSVLEDYSANINSKLQTEPRQALHAHDANALKGQMEALTDYKKNIWMSVAAMCVALSTSCFFLFIYPMTKIRRSHILLVGATDLIAFATLPALLLRRMEIVTGVRHHLPEALKSAHKLVSAESLMNSIQCTIHPREKLPFCSQLIIHSILPVVLLKYLLILCVMTLAYLATAYFIEWCIKHWFPPHCSASDCCCCCQYSPTDTCCCCGCLNSHVGNRKGGVEAGYNVETKKNGSCGGCCSSPSSRYDHLYGAGAGPNHKVWRLQREYNNKTYLPAVLRPAYSTPGRGDGQWNEQWMHSSSAGLEKLAMGLPSNRSFILPPQTPNPLTGTVDLPPRRNSSPLQPIFLDTTQKKDTVEVDEPIPAEPKPSDC